METSIEKPIKYSIVCGEMAFDEQKGKFECPPTTLNNKKKLPQKGVPMQEGEMSIKLGLASYEKDENGKIVNVKFINKENEKDSEEMTH